MENSRLQIGESTQPNGTDQTRQNDDASNTSEIENEEQEDENEEDDEEEDTGKLEEEVKEIAKKVENYRSTLPDQLKSTLVSLLASQRPAVSLSFDHDHGGPEPGPSSGTQQHQGAGSSFGLSSEVLPANDDENTTDDVNLLRDKISSNISAMPIILKRMNECMSRIDKLVSSNDTIHPAFKRKKS